MNVLCPICDQSFAAGETESRDLLEQLECPSCGSHISLLAHGLDEADDRQANMAGRFTLIEELGRGAFGSVWKGRDEQLDRFVAVKLPRKEKLAEREVAQFLREARAAAQLRHPHIVSVHETGRDRGQPFIVSDFVEGETLAEWLTSHRSSIRDAAGLVTKLATAVHYAHQQGVIHRDLKPANILIDGSGQPHITDFGLAKHEAADVTMTLDGQIMGTPAYMSPEQARGETHQVTAASDIYSLGVILFELTTCELPFRGSPTMLIMQILNEDPPSLRKLHRRVPRDLETICLKCLAKDPGRRYPHAAALADDLQRFLRHETIAARPVSPLGRAWRWCRRYPVVASLSGALLIALVSGIGAVSSQWLRAEANLAESERQRLHARKNFEMAMSAVDRYLTRITDDPKLKSQGFEVLRRDLLDMAREFYDDFLSGNEEELELRLARGRAYVHLATINAELGEMSQSRQNIQAAINNYRAALMDDDEPDREAVLAMAISLTHLGELHRTTGQFQLALDLFHEACMCLDQLGAREDEGRDVRHDLAQILYLMGLTHEFRGHVADADNKYQEAIALQQSLVEEEHEHAESPGDPDNHFQLAKSEGNYAYFVSLQDRFDEAERLQRKAIDRLAAVVKEHPAVPKYRRQLALSHTQLGILYRRREQYDQAEQQYNQAVALAAQLAREHPDMVEYQARLAETYSGLGNLAGARGDLQRGIELLGKSSEIMAGLVEEVPDQTQYQSGLAAALVNLGGLLVQNEQIALAEHRMAEALERFRQLVESHPQALELAVGLAKTSLNLAEMMRDQERWQDADAYLREPIGILEAILAESPDFPILEQLLSESYALLARTLDDAGGHGSEAISHWESALELASPEERVVTECGLSRSLILHGRLTDGIARAEQISEQSDLDGTAEFHLAKVFAVATSHIHDDKAVALEKRPAQAGDYAATVLTHLQAAQSGGYFEDTDARDTLRDDPDFGALRDDPSFSKFIENVNEQDFSSS